MKRYLALIAVVLVLNFGAKPENLSQNISSITANIKIGKTIQVMKLDEPVFRNVICNFSITQTTSTPPSVILAGTVVDNNAGIGTEFVPIFFGLPLQPPRLAALTNTDGQFRFRVWLLDKPYGKPLIDKPSGKAPALAARKTGMTTRLQTIAIREATLYLEGRFDKDAEMLSGYTHIYSLREFVERSAKKKP